VNVALPRSLNVDQFLAWAVRQKEGKYELIDGVVIKGQPQNWGHSKTRMQVFLALREAIDERPSDFYVCGDTTPGRVDARHHLDAGQPMYFHS